MNQFNFLGSVLCRSAEPAKRFTHNFCDKIGHGTDRRRLTEHPESWANDTIPPSAANYWCLNEKL